VPLANDQNYFQFRRQSGKSRKYSQLNHKRQSNTSRPIGKPDVGLFLCVMFLSLDELSSDGPMAFCLLLLDGYRCSALSLQPQNIKIFFW
jgi:hypothetical protein